MRARIVTLLAQNGGVSRRMLRCRRSPQLTLEPLAPSPPYTQKNDGPQSKRDVEGFEMQMKFAPLRVTLRHVDDGKRRHLRWLASLVGERYWTSS